VRIENGYRSTLGCWVGDGIPGPRPVLAVCAALALAACVNNPMVTRMRTPHAPMVNDAAYAVSGMRSWYLVPNDLTAGSDTLHVAVVPPASVQEVRLFLDGKWQGNLREVGDSLVRDLDISRLAPGEHEVLLSNSDEDTAFAAFPFTRTCPIYVVTSADWDHPYETPWSPGAFDAGLAHADELHARHPALRITHFVGPHAFTDPTIAQTRQDSLAAWAIHARDVLHDEIGLHVHPFCNFVEAAGLACILDTTYEAAGAYKPGYAIPCFLYTEEEFTTLLRYADTLFAHRGLGKPTSFRAGGWWAEAHTLAALAGDGFLIDASGCNYKRAFDGNTTGAMYEWYATTWGNMTDTTQPYYPSLTNVSVADSSRPGVLEAPDNGILVDYISVTEMKTVFAENWNGKALAAPKQFSVGYHPSTLDNAHFAALDSVFTHCDQFLAEQDNGPVVYARMSELVQVWTK